MLGRFLELSLVTPDTGAAWQQYQQLGFEPAPTGDIWSYPYGVVACEGLAIGLHATGDEPLGISFVRPEVARLHRELSASRVDVEQARLGSDVFNELTLREPDGVALRVLEARSFSPPLHTPLHTTLGRFVSLSLPSSDMEVSRGFWEGLGYQSAAMENPWEGFAIAGLPLAVHARRMLAEPLLVFGRVTDQIEAPQQPALKRERALASLRALPHARLRLPADVAALVLG